MNREEIENRIEVCELREKGYREVGNSKLADKYENEKNKWEKLLSDLELLNERKIAELLEYKKGYFNLEQENKKLHNKIDKAVEYMNGEEFFLLMNSIQTPDKAVCEDYFKAKGNLLEILKDSDVDD